MTDKRPPDAPLKLKVEQSLSDPNRAFVTVARVDGKGSRIFRFISDHLGLSEVLQEFRPEEVYFEPAIWDTLMRKPSEFDAHAEILNQIEIVHARQEHDSILSIARSTEARIEELKRLYREDPCPDWIGVDIAAKQKQLAGYLRQADAALAKVRELEAALTRRQET